MTILREDLIKTFEHLQADFNQALKDAQHQEKAFNQACQTFQENVARHLKRTRRKISDSNPMTQPLDNATKKLEVLNHEWDEKTKNRDKGVRFRAGFNDSLLVFVYGKVKSGKSSLGNYLAWGNTDPTNEIKAQTPEHLHPVYFSGERTEVENGDAHKEAEHNRQFRVGATEATSTIQGFSLPGLTWVDSPGLHSSNAKNGELAKQYVEQADLILYTMSSDSVSRGSDVEEIVELYRADKKTLLLITGSDDVEEDDDDMDGIISTVVMKNPDTRAEQRECTRTALEQLPELKGKTDNIDILSCSARYAQLHNTEASAFHDSGMGQLFDTLQKIATQDGIKLKQQVPMKNFSHFMKSHAEDIKEYKSTLKSIRESVKDIESNIPNKINKSTTKLKKHLREWIEGEFKLLESKSEYDNEASMQQNLQIFSEKLKKEHTDVVIAEKNSLLQEFSKELHENLLVCIQDSKLFDMPDFSVESKKSSTPQIKAGNKRTAGVIGAGVGAVLGGALGSIVPGAGTATGALIGSGIGGFVGNLLGQKEETIFDEQTIKVGDNLIEIKTDILKRMEKAITNQMQRFEKDLTETAIRNIETLDNAINQEIIAFENSLEKINREIAQYLNSK